MDSKTAHIPADTKAFLESILQDAGMTSLDEQTHEQMVLDLFKRLDAYMLTTIVESLPDDKLEEFTKMAESGKSKADLETYIKTHVPDAVEVFARAMLEFRNFYLGNVGVSKNVIQNSNATAGITDQKAVN